MLRTNRFLVRCRDRAGIDSRWQNVCTSKIRLQSLTEEKGGELRGLYGDSEQKISSTDIKFRGAVCHAILQHSNADILATYISSTVRVNRD